MATHRFETVLQAEDSGVFFEVPWTCRPSSAGQAVELLCDGRRHP